MEKPTVSWVKRYDESVIAHCGDERIYITKSVESENRTILVVWLALFSAAYPAILWNFMTKSAVPMDMGDHILLFISAAFSTVLTACPIGSFLSNQAYKKKCAKKIQAFQDRLDEKHTDTWVKKIRH